jgi:hypothetical protein
VKCHALVTGGGVYYWPEIPMSISDKAKRRIVFVLVPVGLGIFLWFMPKMHGNLFVPAARIGTLFRQHPTEMLGSDSENRWYICLGASAMQGKNGEQAMRKLTGDQRLRRKQAFWEVLIYIGLMAELTVFILLDKEAKLRQLALVVGPVAAMFVVGGIEFVSKLSIVIFGRDVLFDRR